MEKKKVYRIVGFTIGLVVGAIAGVWIMLALKTRPHREPVLTERQVQGWTHVATVDPVYMMNLQFTDSLCTLSHCHLFGGIDTVYQNVIYGIDYQFMSGMLFDDSIAADTLIFYHKQGDSVVLRTFNSSKKDKVIKTRIQMGARWMDAILSDTISAIGFYTWHHGLIKTPVRPEATEDMQTRYELLKQHMYAE